MVESSDSQVLGGLPGNSAVILHSLSCWSYTFFKVLMQPGKRKFFCTAANCKDTMYKRNVMRNPALSINAHISICVIAQPSSVHVHVHCIREDFLNTNINL